MPSARTYQFAMRIPGASGRIGAYARLSHTIAGGPLIGAYLEDYRRDATRKTPEIEY